MLPEACIIGATFYQTSKPNINVAARVRAFGHKSSKIWTTAFVIFEPKHKYELHLFNKQISRFSNTNC